MTAIQRTPSLFQLEHALHPAQLLYWHHDRQLFVYQNQHYRWLCLGNTVQSVMDLQQPTRLVLPHLHALALGLYLQPHARQVLECGLGGGAFGRFLARYFPQAAWNCIEFDQTIIHCFEKYFNPGGLSVNCQQADAREAIGGFSGQDLLLLDVFEQNRPPAFLADGDFYARCFHALNDHGVLVVNLLPSPHVSLLGVSSCLLQASGHLPKVIRIPGYRNLVLLAGKRSLPSLNPGRQLLDFAARCELDLRYLQLMRD